MDDNKPVALSELLESLPVYQRGQSKTATEALQASIEEAIKGAQANNKEASVTLSLKFKPARNNEMVVVAEVSEKQPKPAPTPVAMFTDTRARLFHTDPRQRALPGVSNVVPMAANKE